MIKYYYTLVLLIISISTNTAQEIFNPNNFSFSCSGKVIMPELTNTVYVYNGIDSLIETQEFIIKTEATSVWEKRKADRNCVSANPDDCLVWCLKETPATEEIYAIISDTLTTSDWYPYEYIIRPAGEKRKTPVVCKGDLSKELITALSERLYQLGYDIKPTKKYKKLKGKLNNEFKQFQKDHELPIGKWTRATMKYLYNNK